MSNEQEDANFELLMPFIVCMSRGGTYEDRSFVAGFTCAVIDHDLQQWAHGPQIERWVPPDLMPQLDLLAMRRGWTLTSEPWEEAPDEWVAATFTRVSDAAS